MVSWSEIPSMSYFTGEFDRGLCSPGIYFVSTTQGQFINGVALNPKEKLASLF